MWKLSCSDLQGLLPSLCQTAWFCWDHREWPCAARDSSGYEPSLERKGCLPSRPKKRDHKSFKSFLFLFHWLHQGLEIHEARGKAAETKSTHISQSTVTPQGAWGGCCLWRCSHFSAYTVLPRFLHQILLKTISLRRIENQRNHRKGQNIKQITFLMLISLEWYFRLFSLHFF